jgi:hypothetical protein
VDTDVETDPSDSVVRTVTGVVAGAEDAGEVVPVALVITWLVAYIMINTLKILARSAPTVTDNAGSFVVVTGCGTEAVSVSA